MTRDSRGHRRLIAGDAGNERGARHLMAIEFGHPSIRQHLGAAGSLPAKTRGDGARTIVSRKIGDVLGENLEKT